MSEEVVRGAEVTIRFNGKRCIHARNCVLGRPDVFVPNVQGEWIHPERASAAQVLELAHNCPSGAIQCEQADGTTAETAPRVNTVRLRENGPLAFHGPLTVDGVGQGMRLTLCRCGASASKPYCDGSHAAVNFSASGEAAAATSQPLQQRDGPLAVTATRDGPLHVTGNLEVVTGTGKTIHRVTDVWLCRCGASGNKPYCDGAHRRIGFKTE